MGKIPIFRHLRPPKLDLSPFLLPKQEAAAGTSEDCLPLAAVPGLPVGRTSHAKHATKGRVGQGRAIPAM